MAKKPHMTARVALGALALCGMAHIANAAPPATSCQWKVIGTADLNGDGKVQRVEMRTCGHKGSVRATINGQTRSFEFPIGTQDQFGVCGVNLSASVEPKSDPRDALGTYPPGYDTCLNCAEIIIRDGDCDALHIYWRKDTKSFHWWRL